MARVFISYASIDLSAANDLRERLAASGHDVFQDRAAEGGIAIGEDWKQRLVERLSWADAVVCLVTTDYVASRWCFAEIAIAIEHGSRLLPLEVEPGVRHELLSEIQYGTYRDSAGAAAAIDVQLRQLEVTAGWSWPEGRAPYPGLRAFDATWHRVFFGRTLETKQLTEALRYGNLGRDILMITGPSGCGKSSLVRAGLIPAMSAEDEWVSLGAFVPGVDPVGALAAEIVEAARLLDLGWDLPAVRARLSEAGGLVGLAREILAVASRAGRRKRRLLLVVDQFEELVTISDPDAADVVIQRIAECSHGMAAGPVTVVCTLRPDFLAAVAASPATTTLPFDVWILRPLKMDALRTIIEAPARMAGLRIEPDLVTTIVDDAGAGDTLPLLAFTLEQLTEGLQRGAQISRARYEQLGGVAGALRQQADLALAQAARASGRDQAQVIASLLQLVTVDENGNPTRRRVPMADATALERSELDAFVRQRLLTVDQDAGDATASVSHEAFLTAWPPLADAIAHAGSALRRRREIELASAEWTAEKRPARRLWQGRQLAVAIADLETGQGKGRRHDPTVLDGLSKDAAEFVRRSLRHDRRRRRGLSSTLTGLLVVAVAAAATAVFFERNAAGQRDLAQARQLTAEAENVMRFDPMKALRIGVAANAISSTPETRLGLYRNLRNTRMVWAVDVPDDARSITLSEDGKHLLTGSYSFAQWDLAGASRPIMGSLTDAGLTRGVAADAVSPTGRMIAVADWDVNLIWLWDITGTEGPRRFDANLAGHRGDVNTLAFTHDGRILASGSADRTVRLWDVSDPSSPAPIGAPINFGAEVEALAFSPDGRHLAVGGLDRSTELWNLSNPAKPVRLSTLAGAAVDVTSLAFSPSGKSLAVGGANGVIELWSTASGERAAPLTEHTKAISVLTFSPDGRRLASGSDDSKIIIWDVTDPGEPQQVGDSLLAHSGYINDLVFTSDGETLYSAGDFRLLIMWNLADLGEPLGQITLGDHTEGIQAAAFSPNGRLMATADGSGQVLLWGVDGKAWPKLVGRFRAGNDELFGIHSMAFSPDGRLLATGGDGHIQLTDVSIPAEPNVVGSIAEGQSLIQHLGFRPDGQVIAFSVLSSSNAAQPEKPVYLYDIRQPTQPIRLANFNGHDSDVRAVAFAESGTRLITAAQYGDLVVWDVDEPSKPVRLSGAEVSSSSMQAAAVNGDLVAVAAFDGLELMRLVDGKRLVRIGELDGDYASAIEISPDGRRLATSISVDNGVHLFDLTDPTSPRPIGDPLVDHYDSVNALTFGHDGRTLVSGGADHTVVVWKLEELESVRIDPVAHACRMIGTGFKDNEWNLAVGYEIPYQSTCNSS